MPKSTIFTEWETNLYVTELFLTGQPTDLEITTRLTELTET
jgi:hypothetical protein